MSVENDSGLALELCWLLPAFLSSNSHEEQGRDETSLTEQLKPEDFQSAERAAEYWSIPEILTEARWLAQRSGDMEIENDEGCFPENGGMAGTYNRILEGFRKIVTFLGYQTVQYKEAVDVLNQVDRNVVEFWRIWKHKLSRKHDHLPPWGWDVAGAFLHFHLDSIKELSHLKESAEKLADLIYSGGDYPNPDSREEVDEIYQKFENSVREYCKNTLNTKEINDAAKKLYQLEHWVQRVLNDHNQQNEFKSKDKWDPEYYQSVWNGMQMVAGCICQSFTPHYNPRVLCLTTGEMLEKIKAESAIILPKVGKWYWKDVFELNKRCIALLKCEKGKPLVSFSGFFDIPPTEATLGKYNTAKPLFEKFRKIAGTFGWTLVVVTDEIAKHILYRKSDSEAVSLMDVVVKNKFDRDKDNYSCCERKILGHLACHKKSPRHMNFYIKMEPCQKCKPVMMDWWKQHLKLECLNIAYIEDDKTGREVELFLLR